MKINKNEISQKFDEIINNCGFLFVDLVFRGDSRNHIIEVYIDNSKGITADDCKKVSGSLSEVIEEENLIDSKFRLNVSSPGIERPLKFLQQFPKHLNRKFEIIYLNEEEEIKISAKLISIEEEVLELQTKKETLKISFKNIKTAKVLVSF